MPRVTLLEKDAALTRMQGLGIEPQKEISGKVFMVTPDAALSLGGELTRIADFLNQSYSLNRQRRSVPADIVGAVMNEQGKATTVFLNANKALVKVMMDTLLVNNKESIALNAALCPQGSERRK